MSIYSVLAPRSVKASRPWKVPDDSLVIGCVANINPQKGIVTLVRAFAQIRERFPMARLVLVGAEYETHAAYSASVRATINRAGLRVGRDVFFVGDRADVHRQLAGIGCVRICTRVKGGSGYSTAVLEAMAAGVPVVTTAVAGLPEAIEDRVSGIFVPPDRPPSMADAVFELLRNPSMAVRVGGAARRRAVTSFEIARASTNTSGHMSEH